MAASVFWTTRPGPRPTACTTLKTAMIVNAARFCGESVSDSDAEREREPRASSSATRARSAEEAGQADGGGGDGAGETGDERRPPGEERGQRPVGGAQIDVLAAGARPHRRQLGVGHRPGEREQAADQPHRHQRPGFGRHARDDGRHQQDAEPMTFDTTTAAASIVPSRRSSIGRRLALALPRTARPGAHAGGPARHRPSVIW